MSNPDYITPEGEELYYDEMEDLYAEWLDEVCDEVVIGSLTYSPSHVLREVDPIAFRVGMSDYLDMRMSDDEDLDEWREGHPWLGQDDEEEEDDE